MHLLQSGVDITAIALWLGHDSTETTHCYVEADLATKQKALDKLVPANGKLVFGVNYKMRPTNLIVANQA